jgi:hypothetical protein
MYAWFVDESGARDLARGLGEQIGPGLIYAGQAGAGTSSATLASRIRGNHLAGNIYASTLRRTLASILRDPLRLEPIGGRRMKSDGESRLGTWISAHLCVSIVAFEDRLLLDTFETTVLLRLDPPLNLAKVPQSAIRTRLAQLRRPFGFATEADMAPATRAKPRLAALIQRANAGPTPEQLAHELGLSNAKGVRAYLRRTFPRPESELWSAWGPLEPEVVAAVRSHFRGR